MSNISTIWTDEVVLPDGSVATCAADIDKYMKRSGTALATDYSADYMAGVKQRQQREEQQSLHNDLLCNYKRSIWYAK